MNSPELMPFQKVGVANMLHFLRNTPTKAVYNADEQGLGKTIQALAVANELQLDSPVPLNILIFAPKVMLHTWAKEANIWIKDCGNICVIDSKKDLRKFGMSRIVILNHESARIYESVLIGREWDLLIIDEAHKVKNSRAKRTKVILGELWPHAKYKIALSGTPLTQSVADAFSLFSRMSPDDFPSYSRFIDKWAVKVDSMYGIKYVGIKKPKELGRIIRKKFFIRRKKAEVLPDLPKKIWKEIVLPAREYLLPEYEKEIAKLKPEVIFARIEAGENISNSFGLLSEMRRQQGELKVPPVVEYVRDLLEQDIPVVLFGYHRNVISSYMTELDEFNPVVIRGETSGKERFQAVEDFQSGKTNLFIGQLQSASVGITLTRSSNMVLGELDWSPSVLVQAVDRINRIGTVETSIIHYFTVENSLEDRILKSVLGKAKSFSKVIDGK